MLTLSASTLPMVLDELDVVTKQASVLGVVHTMLVAARARLTLPKLIQEARGGVAVLRGMRLNATR